MQELGGEALLADAVPALVREVITDRIGQSRRVGEQLLHRDRGLVTGHVREEIGQGRIGREAAGIDQAGNRHAGKTLGDREDVDLGVEGEGAAGGGIGETGPARENDLAIAGDGGKAGEAGLRQLVETGIEPRLQCRFGLGRRGGKHERGCDRQGEGEARYRQGR